MNPALLQKGSNSFRTDSEIKDHEGRKKAPKMFSLFQYFFPFYANKKIGMEDFSEKPPTSFV